MRYAIIILGPSAAGKTTVSKELLSRLHRKFSTKVGYISGDCVSAQIYPKTFDDSHLAFKYGAISSQIERIQEEFLIVDDLFRRRCDYDSVTGALEANGFNVRAWQLTPSLQQVLLRNKMRMPPTRMPEKRLLRIYLAYTSIDFSDVLSMGSSFSPSKVSRTITESLAFGT